jgi:hypothetical protein
VTIGAIHQVVRVARIQIDAVAAQVLEGVLNDGHALADRERLRRRYRHVVTAIVDWLSASRSVPAVIASAHAETATCRWSSRTALMLDVTS